jgi:glutathione peroxidase-family protein
MQGSTDAFPNIPAYFWHIPVHDIDGNAKLLNDYKGAKAYLIVNVASQCGYTKKNYEELTQLFTDHKDNVRIIFLKKLLLLPCVLKKQATITKLQRDKFYLDKFV